MCLHVFACLVTCHIHVYLSSVDIILDDGGNWPNYLISFHLNVAGLCLQRSWGSWVAEGGGWLMFVGSFCIWIYVHCLGSSCKWTEDGGGERREVGGDDNNNAKQCLLHV